jgi:hypothetical protein
MRIILIFALTLPSAMLLAVCAQQPIMKVEGKESNLVYLQKLEVDIRIHGATATTTWTMTFKNRSGRILEGELNFPLADGVSVSRYALDVNGRLREAVPVEKEKGTMVFESIVRRGVDPGLLEKVEVNGFRTRIYPINPGGVRTVLIGYEEELALGQGESLRWHLPLAFVHPLEEFRLNMQVLKGCIKPSIEQNIDDGFQFSEWQDVWSASQQWKQFKGDKSLTVVIPKATDDKEVAMQPSGNHYLYLLSAFPQTKKIAKPKPHRLTIFWDASLSGLHRDHEKEIKLLDIYFKELQKVEVTLVPFHYTVGAAKAFAIEGGTWEALRDSLIHMVYDGGTQFGKLRPDLYPGDEYLLFSDGQSNFGSDKTGTFSKPLYAIVATAKADLPFLRSLTEPTGGELVNLEISSIQEAKRQLLYQSLYFLGEKKDPELEECYPSTPTPVINGISVAGICYQPKHEVVLQFGYAGKVVSEEKVMLDASRQNTGDDLTRTWAQKKIEQLDKRFEDNKLEIFELGRRYGIVTRNTSLIVLENVQDYVTYNIEPPAELREAYDRLIKSNGQLQRQQQRTAMEEADKYFQELLEWSKPNNQAQPRSVAREYRSDTFRYISPNAGTTSQLSQSLQGRAAGVAIRGASSERANAVASPPAPRQGEMQEVVVVGYGTARKREVTSSVTSVQSGYLSSKADDRETEARSKAKDNNKSDGGDFKAFGHEVTTAYLDRLRKTPSGNQYAVYLQERQSQLYTPVFYFNTAEFFLKEGKKELGLKVLSNIAELDVESYELYKMLGYELRSFGETAEACAAFKKVLEWRPFEPQSFRDYGLALWDAGLYQQALDTLYAALTKNYDANIAAQYPGIEETILPEINCLVALKGDKVDFSGIPKRLLTNMPVDMRVVLNWNMNDTDIDLWVTDPFGEKCFYSHRTTAIGGRISHDFTRGFGPEQFLLKKGHKGRYKVEVDYYGDRQTKLAGPTTILLELYTHYATEQQTRKLIPLQMQAEGERTVLIGEFEL